MPNVKGAVLTDRDRALLAYVGIARYASADAVHRLIARPTAARSSSTAASPSSACPVAARARGPACAACTTDATRARASRSGRSHPTAVAS